MSFNGELLKKLASIYAPSSNEGYIREFIENEIKEYVDKIEVDNMGNLICRKKGKGKKIMIASHMDQIGVIVTSIEKEGFLRFSNVGGISPIISLYQKVKFENGTIGVIHKDEKASIGSLKLEDLFIDIGSNSKEESEKKIGIGDIAVYYSEYYEDEKRVVSGAMDNRIGCFVALETAKKMVETDYDIYYVFTVQEEVGLRGAKTSAYKIKPDFSISLDITGSGDTPESERLALSLGGGTAIKVKDKGIIVNPKVKSLMIEVAKKNNIDYQLEVLEYGATDSGAIHLSRGGVLSGVISVPTRYIHSPVETVYKSDIEESIKLLSAIFKYKELDKIL